MIALEFFFLFFFLYLFLLNFRVTLKTSCECCITLHLTMILVERLFAEAADLYLLKALSACLSQVVKTPVDCSSQVDFLTFSCVDFFAG